MICVPSVTTKRYGTFAQVKKLRFARSVGDACYQDEGEAAEKR